MTHGFPTPDPNTTPEPSTAVRPDVATRFKPGNTAARRHGLRAGTRAELRRRDRRTENLLRRYLQTRADLGRPIGPTQVPLARRYVELECLARDFYALLTSDKPEIGTLSRYISITRAQSLLASQLGESVSRQPSTDDSLSVLRQIAGARKPRLVS